VSEGQRRPGGRLGKEAEHLRLEKRSRELHQSPSAGYHWGGLRERERGSGGGGK